MAKQATEAQKAAAVEKRARFNALVKQVAAMSDEQRKALADQAGAVLTCEGRALSVHNTLLLFMQCPGVSMVGGFHQWIKAGRSVRKGEHGLSIWIPTARASAVEGAPAEIGFICGSVFDVSQTDEVAQEQRAA